MVLADIVSFLVRCLPFLRHLFPTYSEGRREFTPLPAGSRVAIVGAGVGGCSAAYFLRELGGEDLDIHVWQRKGEPVGGRAAVVDFSGHIYESGGAVIHSSNKHMVDFAKQFDLQTKSGKDEGVTPLGIYNGQEFVFRTTTLGVWNTIKTLWHYGFSLIRLNLLVRSILKKFCTIYDIQASGQSFETVPELLRAMGGEDMFQLTQLSARDYLIREHGYPENIVDELVTAALRVNYGQNSGVDSFTTLVALAGMEDGNLWNVVGGNRQIPENLLRASNATFHTGEVQKITRVETGGRVSYTIEDCSSSQETFDVVIFANPLNVSKVKFENFPNPIYTGASTTPYQRTVATFIRGEVNPSFFGLENYDRYFPQAILTTELSSSPFEYRSVSIDIPAEIPGDQVKDYEKPVRDEPMRVWKVFSPEPLTDEEKRQMFRKIEDDVTIDWLAYPVYDPPEECPNFVLDDGLFYINGIEKAASAMEMSAIGGKNVALLARYYLANISGQV